MKLETLRQVVASDAALRYRVRLQPAGGAGDKVFPPTYEGAKYAEEKRRIGDAIVPCVHLDSVQSQANRMELALLEAMQEKRIHLPVVMVDFAATNDPTLRDVGKITSLEAPHRLADAILRDSCAADGTRFRDTPEGKVLDSSSIASAAAIFGINPTALLFGVWDSTGPKGGLGVKFQRAIVSELAAINTERGVRTSSRIDPLGIMANSGVLYRDPATGGWTLETKGANAKPLEKYGKEGKPSAANHGNVTPTIEESNGGITFAYALQTVVLSLPALRRLRFPIDGHSETARDLAARTALAALGLCGAVLSNSKGYDLRSRCLLVPETPGQWETLHGDGTTTTFDLLANDACALFNEAVEAAKSSGLPWREEPLVLKPSEGLARLVINSRNLLMQSKAED